MAIPVICGFEPVPQGAMQMFAVPAVPTTMPQFEQQYSMYASFNTWGAIYCGPTGYHGMHQNSPFRKRAQKAPAWKHDAPFAQSQQPDGKDVTVVLGNLPKMMCAEECFKVALEATKVEDAVRLFSVEQCGDSGEAVVILNSEAAAQIVIKHFRGVKYGRSDGVTACYCEEAGKKLLRSKELKENPDQKQQSQDEKQEQAQDETTFKQDAHSPSSGAHMVQCQTELATMVAPLVLTKTNLKMRWADVKDDSDSDDEDDGQSTAAGPSRSSSEWTSEESSNPGVF